MKVTGDLVARTIIPLIGRILIALPLIKFGTDKVRNFDRVYEWMQYIHFPAAALSLSLANTIELMGALCLITGLWTRRAALAIALYLIPVHLTVHNFWGPDVAERASEIESFGKGMMIMGGLLFVFLAGPGALSIDSWLQSRKLKGGSGGLPKPDAPGLPGVTG